MLTWLGSQRHRAWVWWHASPSTATISAIVLEPDASLSTHFGGCAAKAILGILGTEAQWPRRFEPFWIPVLHREDHPGTVRAIGPSDHLSSIESPLTATGASQMFTARPQVPEASRLPSGLNITLLTGAALANGQGGPVSASNS
jgi:hypothetical protein